MIEFKEVSIFKTLMGIAEPLVPPWCHITNRKRMMYTVLLLVKHWSIELCKWLNSKMGPVVFLKRLQRTMNCSQKIALDTYMGHIIIYSVVSSESGHIVTKFIPCLTPHL